MKGFARFAALTVVCAVVGSTASAQSEWAGGLEPRMLFAGDAVFFGTDIQPSATCDHWGRYFRFDATTDRGRAMLAVLLTAIASDRKIDVWYAQSTAPGTDQTNGCIESHVSELDRIGIH